MFFSEYTDHSTSDWVLPSIKALSPTNFELLNRWPCLSALMHLYWGRNKTSNRMMQKDLLFSFIFQIRSLTFAGDVCDTLFFTSPVLETVFCSTTGLCQVPWNSGHQICKVPSSGGGWTPRFFQRDAQPSWLALVEVWWSIGHDSMGTWKWRGWSSWYPIQRL